MKFLGEKRSEATRRFCGRVCLSVASSIEVTVGRNEFFRVLNVRWRRIGD